jgi:hypothetical protein
MKISQTQQTPEGYLKYSKLEQIDTNTAPKLIFAKVFSYSDIKAEQFLRALESIYKNPLLKPMLDVMAVYIAKNDDLLITYGATLPSDTNGRYTGNCCRNINDQSANNYKNIQIQAFLNDELLLSVITHEFAHFLADVIFGNSLCGFKDNNQQAIYSNALKSFALKYAQLVDPKLVAGIYNALDGKQILNLVFNQIVNSDNPADQYNNGSKSDEVKKSIAFGKNFFIPTSFYTDDSAKDSEVFVKIITSFLLIKAKPDIGKFLGEFLDYYSTVLNPAIDEYMHGNQSILDKLGIKPNELNSYGINLGGFSKPWDINDELYFAIINGEDLKAKELIINGANPGHIFFGVHKIINIALTRGNWTLVKFMTDHSKNIDFGTKDYSGKTSFALAKDISDEAYDLIKGFEPKIEEAEPTTNLEYSTLEHAIELHQSYGHDTIQNAV